MIYIEAKTTEYGVEYNGKEYISPEEAFEIENEEDK